MTSEVPIRKPEIKRPIYAVGLFIVNVNTGLIWCVKELSSSAKTAKSAGQISIPLETKKVNETSIGTAIGGLEEFKALEENDSLIYIENQVSSKGRHKYENGNFVDFVVLGYSSNGGKGQDNLQVADPQVEGLGWFRIDDLLTRPDLRTGLRSFLELAKNERWIENFLMEFQTNKSAKVVLTRNDPRLNYIQERIKLKDFHK